MPLTRGIVRRSGDAPPEATATLRVLLIDHVADHGQRLQAQLAGRSDTFFTIEQVPDLASAVSRLTSIAPADVVLLALDLPDGKGLDVARMILQTSEGFPVVILATDETEADAWRATELGAQDVVLRDRVTPDVLAWVLKHAVEQFLIRASLERHIRELELTNGRFLSLVADNADAIVVVDRVGIVRFVNPTAERLLQCSASDLLGQMFGIPLEGVETTEIDLPRRSGQMRTAEIRVMRTLWDGERAFIVSMRDISERKRDELALKLAKQQAEQASEMKSQFLANMSHELRTPLNAIIGYSEMMMMGIAGPVQPDRYQGYVKDIHEGGQHLLSLINDLLDLSKAESGQLGLSDEKFDLVMLADEIVDFMAGQADSGGIHLRASAEMRAAWLRGDQRMIKQVMLNLVSNALKFTPKGGAVTVAINRNVHGDTRIMVKDTGIGIPKEQIPRAFAAFVQIDNAYRRTENKGTGLGLALAKRFVELHQGKIAVDSTENVGTTVTVTLPKSRALGAEGGEVVPLGPTASGPARNRTAG